MKTKRPSKQRPKFSLNDLRNNPHDLLYKSYEKPSCLDTSRLEERSLGVLSSYVVTRSGSIWHVKCKQEW